MVFSGITECFVSDSTGRHSYTHNNNNINNKLFTFPYIQYDNIHWLLFCCLVRLLLLSLTKKVVQHIILNEVKIQLI